MKQELIGLSQRYVTALRKHLKLGPRAILPCGAELARIHERALATLELSNRKSGLIKRAEIFLPGSSSRSCMRIAPRMPLQTQMSSCFYQH
jgi:hypothetical protein